MVLKPSPSNSTLRFAPSGCWDAPAARPLAPRLGVTSLACLAISLVAAAVAMCAMADTGQVHKKEIAKYPSVATQVHAAKIRSGFPAIAVGMAPADVVAILGEPDELHPLYEPSAKNGKIIGYTYWYVVQRIARQGSAIEKQESVVRVSFALDDRVSKIDAWGL